VIFNIADGGISPVFVAPTIPDFQIFFQHLPHYVEFLCVIDGRRLFVISIILYIITVIGE